MHRQVESNPETGRLSYIAGFIARGLELSKETPVVFYHWLILKSIGMQFTETPSPETSREMINEYFLGDQIISSLSQVVEEPRLRYSADLIQILVEEQDWYEKHQEKQIPIRTYMSELFARCNQIHEN